MNLGSITGILVHSNYEGFDYPEVAGVTPLLGDGSSSSGNAVLQGGALGFREAAIAGTILGSTDAGSLRTYYQNKTAVTFTDDIGTSYTVRVMDLKMSRIEVASTPGWAFSCRLVEVV